MGLLQTIATRANKLDAMLSRIEASRFKWYRDPNTNLLLRFEDGTRIKLPYIPMRPYQASTRRKFFIEKKNRFLVQRPRRAGKEVESWSLVVEAAITQPGLYLMVYPHNVRARAVLWEGAMLMPDGQSVPFLDMIPQRLIKRKKDDLMRIYLTNGSIIWVLGSDIDPNKLRGTNPRGMVISEFAFCDPRVFYIMLPVFRQNGGWLWCQSTYDGMNHFWQTMQNNKDDPLWVCENDSVETLLDENGNRYITEEMIDEDRRAGMPEYLIQQEYYGNVQINQETKYFAYAMKHIYENNKIIEKLHIPNAPVYTAWDIGLNDSCAITIFQTKRVQNYIAPVIIGYIESNNHDLGFYVNEIRNFCNKYNLHIREHFLPHDGKKRDFNTGKNTEMFMQEMGESCVVVPRPNSKENAIEAMRRKLFLAEFNKEHTQRLIDCLANYSKEFDDKMGTYKKRPIHNWASHGVDSFQTMTLALDAQLVNEAGYEVVYYHNQQPHGYVGLGQ